MKSFKSFEDAKREALKTGGHVIDIHGSPFGLHVVPQAFALNRSYYHNSDGEKVKFSVRFINETIRYHFPTVTAQVNGFQIKPCRISDNGRDIEVCEAGEADFWTVYTHLKNEQIHLAVADFATEGQAESLVVFLKAFAANYIQE